MKETNQKFVRIPLSEVILLLTVQGQLTKALNTIFSPWSFLCCYSYRPFLLVKEETVNYLKKLYSNL